MVLDPKVLQLHARRLNQDSHLEIVHLVEKFFGYKTTGSAFSIQRSGREFWALDVLGFTVLCFPVIIIQYTDVAQSSFSGAISVSVLQCSTDIQRNDCIETLSVIGSNSLRHRSSRFSM